MSFKTYAIFLYENNVDTTLNRVKIAKPRLATDIEAAKEVTLESPGQAKLLHHELLVATAYDIGAKDKGAGIVLLNLAFDAQNKSFSDAQEAYNSADLSAPYVYGVDTAMVEPTDIHNKGTEESPIYVETYSDVIPGKLDGSPDQVRVYDGRLINNQLTGKNSTN